MRNRSQRGQHDRLMNLKRGSVRGIQTLFAAQGISPYSSNSSIDGRISPAPSFATSAHDVSFAFHIFLCVVSNVSQGFSGSSSSFLTPTLGFASNLSHTIIREAQEDDDRSVRSDASDSTNVSITDEELAAIFTDADIKVNSARIVRRRWGKPRKSKGFGFVDVGDEEQQKKAIELLNGKEISGRPIAVKIAVNTPHDDEDEGEDAEKADAPAEVAPAAEPEA